MNSTYILFKHIWVSLLILAMIGVCPFVARAGTPDTAQVHHLPSVHSLAVQPSRLLEDFRVHDFHAKNLAGEVLSAPAFLLDIPSGAGGWISPNPADVPPFPERLPAKVRNRVQLFYNGDKNGSAVGWLIVPRGWTLWTAAMGSDGSLNIEFRSTRDTPIGWMAIGGESGCYGCMPGVVAGLRIQAAISVFEGNEFSPVDAVLSPKPVFLTHPDACTALVMYKSNSDIVHGAVIFYTDDDGNAQGTASLYIGLPRRENNLGKFITKTFLDLHTKPPYRYRCESNTKH